ncbi:hypothetical protein BASA60_001668 [Batrachochytrium salamandrivorans]|nr:hypothetical protein BASA60_001668 [Batrachochytrium salamandrivorans]
MANSDISVFPLSIIGKNHHHLPHSRYTALQPSRSHTSVLFFAPTPGSPDGACLQDRPPHHKTRCSISHNGPRRPTTTTSSSASSAKASKPLGVFAKLPTSPVQTSLDQQPQPPPLSRQILAVNVAISQQTSCYRHIVRNTRLWAISETCITLIIIRFTVPGFDVIPASSPLDLDAEECPSAIPCALVVMNW